MKFNCNGARTSDLSIEGLQYTHIRMHKSGVN